MEKFRLLYAKIRRKHERCNFLCTFVPKNKQMVQLFLVRHGETVDNVNQIMQGQTQGELTENGIRQAEELAHRMRSWHVDAFVASDLKRSIDTCRILAAPHGQTVLTTSLLRERDWGGFAGQYIPAINLNDPWPDDVETLPALKRRASDFIRFLREHYDGQTVVAVGHGIINKAIQAVHFGKAMRDVPRMTNAEVRELSL